MEIEKKSELIKVNIRGLWENFKQISASTYIYIYIYCILQHYVMKPSEDKEIRKIQNNIKMIEIDYK